MARARRAAGDGGELEARRRGQRLLVCEHVALTVTVLTGAALVAVLGLRPLQTPWLALKVGLLALLVVPLEAIHAYVAHLWIGRGLGRTATPPYAKELERGISVQRMILTLAAPLLGLAVPLMVWLSLARPG